MSGKFRIEFHGNQMSCSFEEEFRECAFTWSDLRDDRLVLGARGNCNAPENGRVGQKVLT